MKKTLKQLCIPVVTMAAVFGAMSHAQAADKLSIGLSTWVGYGPLYIAKDKGFFADEGLDVDLKVMEDVKTRMPALIAGRIDAAVTTIDTVLNFYSERHPLNYLFALDDSRGGDGIVADKDIKTIADLKGKKIAFTQGSVSQFFLGVVLKNNGLKLSDIDALNMTAGDAGAAFVAGKVDAAVTWEPWLTRGKSTDHGQLLIDSSKTPGLITDVMVTNTKNLKARKKDMQGLYRAWIKAVEWQKSHEEEADKIMAKGVGGWLKDPKVFAETRSGIVFYDKDMNEKFMDPANDKGITNTIANAETLGRESGLFKLDVKPASLVATDIVK